ncbi:hypothetical protein [Anabaena sp. 4-3]|nr:hypothetical protein [Anabaena sp. 4-3]
MVKLSICQVQEKSDRNQPKLCVPLRLPPRPSAFKNITYPYE